MGAYWQLAGIVTLGRHISAKMAMFQSKAGLRAYEKIIAPPIKKPVPKNRPGIYLFCKGKGCFKILKRIIYPIQPMKAARQPLRKVTASVVVKAYTQ